MRNVPRLSFTLGAFVLMVTITSAPDHAGQNIVQGRTSGGFLAFGGVSGADLRLTKTASATSVVDGSNLTYTLSVRNLGPSTATNLIVSDPLPGEANFISATGSGWTCTEAFSTITCTRPSLAVAVAPAITVVVNVFTDGKSGTICNSATVNSETSDPVPTDNTGQACVDVIPPGICGSLEALLQQASDGSIPLSSRLRFIRTLRAAIDARNAGLRTAEIERIAVFINQVTQAKASLSVDPGTADSLKSCAVALRQQALDDLKFGTSARR